MSFRSLLTLTVAAGAGYVAARELLSDRAPARIERLPEVAQGPVLAARARLLRGRVRAGEALRAGRAEQAIAEQELLAEFHRKAGRS